MYNVYKVVPGLDIVEHVLSQFLFLETSIILRFAFLPLVNLFPRFSDTWRRGNGGEAIAPELKPAGATGASCALQVAASGASGAGSASASGASGCYSILLLTAGQYL